MKLLNKAVVAALDLLGVALALPAPDGTLQGRADGVTVTLPSGTVIGTVDEVESFNGIPYAHPPIGNLRLKPPHRLSEPLGIFNASGTAVSCPQMPVLPDEDADRLAELAEASPLFKASMMEAREDCLTISVQRAKGTRPDQKLPVLFWIYGGGFVYGNTASYDAKGLIQAAVGRQQPFIFVAVNYRVAGFGFLGGKEILADGASNLGLLDQRMGLEWVADNIASFGGDPTKVTLWGESAGAISVFDQMLLYSGNATYRGKPLFRGAIMNSGSATPTDPVDCPKAQRIYDDVVRAAGCDSQTDTLKCLRDAPYDVFLHASSSVPRILSYTSLALSYLPRPDGRTLVASPEVLAKQGRYHAVPMIIGDQEDEGTLFALAQKNVTSTDALTGYLGKYYFEHASAADIGQFVATYPPQLESGSPFRTGIWNQIYVGYKRLAALLGDVVFTLARRLTLDIVTQVNPEVPVWSYLSSFKYGTLVLGTSHGSDVEMMFAGTGHPAKSCRAYYFNFLYNLDPNVGGGVGGPGGYIRWPRWADNRKLLWINLLYNSLTNDDFRFASYNYMRENATKLYF